MPKIYRQIDIANDLAGRYNKWICVGLLGIAVRLCGQSGS